MAFCTNCGNQIPEGSIFCPGCGTKCASEAPAHAEPIPFEETQVLDQSPVCTPVYEEPAPVYQPPVYEQPQQAPVYEQPAYQPPVNEQPPVYGYQPPVYNYQQPIPQAQPVVSAGAKVKGFIGMGLGIGSLAIAVIALIVGFASVGDAYLSGAAIGYSLVAVGLGVPAKILAGKAVEEGFIGTPTKLGSVFGLIGIIVGGVAGFFGIIGLMG